MKRFTKTLSAVGVTMVLSACTQPVSPAVNINQYKIGSTTLSNIIADHKQPRFIRDITHKGTEYTLAQYCQSPNAAGGWTAYGMSLGLLGKPYSAYQAFLFKDNVLVDTTTYDVESASTCIEEFKQMEDLYFATLRS